MSSCQNIMEVYHGSFSIRIVLIVATYRQLIYLTKTNMWNWNMIIKSPNEVWRLIVIAPFLIIIIIILSFFLSFFRQKFIRHISRRLLNGNQWNFTGMLSTMSRCADYFRNFQNGRRCHGNGQNAKKLKNTKLIIEGYSPNRN